MWIRIAPPLCHDKYLVFDSCTSYLAPFLACPDYLACLSVKLQNPKKLRERSGQDIPMTSITQDSVFRHSDDDPHYRRPDLLSATRRERRPGWQLFVHHYQ